VTELSQKILADYQVRKTKAQKLRFVDFIKENIPDASVEEGGFPKSRNIVVGDPEKAKVIFTAHYDTCAVLPFPNLILPKNMPATLLYGILICLPFMAFMLLVQAGVSAITDDFFVIYWASLIALIGSIFGVFFFGPANKHTVNDNTSGVITLIELMASLTEEERAEAAFVFFDNEEYGLIGSSWFRSRHKAAVKNTLLVNFDCVSDGDNILFVLNKKADKEWGEAFKESFQAAEGKALCFESSSKAFYPSDQSGYPFSIGVAAMKKKPLFGLYLDRIHTKRDTVMDEENIKILVDGVCKFVRR